MRSKLSDIRSRVTLPLVVISVMALLISGCSSDFTIYKDPGKEETVSDDSSFPDLKPKAESVVAKDEASDDIDDEDVLIDDQDAKEVPEGARTFKYVDINGNTGEAVINEEAAFFPYEDGVFTSEGSEKTFNAEGYVSRFGIDVSKFQGNVDFKKVRDAGASFVFVRLGFRGFGEDGSLNLDENFKKNLKNAKDAGLDVGVYFYSQAVNEEEAKEEADFVINNLKNETITYPVVFDEEYSYDNADARANAIDGKTATDNAIAFCEKIKSAGYKPCIYAAVDRQAGLLDMGRLKDYEIWYADYESDPQTPYDFKFWQFSNRGKIDGIEGDVDLNVEIINVDKEAEDTVKRMTKEQKVAQLFVVTPETLLTQAKDVTEFTDDLKNGFINNPVGGIILFPKNLKNNDQVRDLNASITSLGKSELIVSPFIAVDEEGGKVARVADTKGMDVKKVEYMSVIGMSKDDKRAYQAGNTIGSYLNDMNFSVDFAPDADVITNPKNEVVKDRSFGEDPDTVTIMAASYLSGLKDNGIIGCYKHFPGHGGTLADSHNGLASTDKTYVEMELYELAPFKSAGENDVPMIMAGHINAPNAIKENVPASMSKEMITDILRDRFGYDGVVITDALNMGAITKKYSPADAAKTAFLAGNDMILMPADYKEAYNGIMDGLKDGSISQERLDESVKRIVTLKLKYGRE